MHPQILEIRWYRHVLQVYLTEYALSTRSLRTYECRAQLPGSPDQTLRPSFSKKASLRSRASCSILLYGITSMNALCSGEKPK